MKLDSFDELSLDGLKDIYSAEQQALQGLTQMQQAASSPELKAAFEEHKQQSEGQVRRLEQIFQTMGQSPEGKECKAAQGLIAEAQELIEEGQPGPVLDAGLIMAAQKFEHYEIASYGTARTFAQRMGQDEVARLLAETLREEEETDRKLTRIAESVINPQAAQQSA
jgi:ferritin-like metal-binding protein YciE